MAGLSAVIRRLELDVNCRGYQVRLNQKGGWRTLFDGFSSEWNDTDIAFKIAALTTFINVVPLDTMVDAYAEYWTQGGRTDIAYAANKTLKFYEDYGWQPARDCRRLKLQDRMKHPSTKEK